MKLREQVDIERWEEIRCGKEEALKDLYLSYYSILIRFGLKYSEELEVIKDSINNTFLYLWEKRTSISEAKNVKNYLLTSFQRQLFKDLNKNGVVDISKANYDTLYYESDEDILIYQQQEERKMELLKNAILQLPSRQRQLISLRYYEGLSYDEIAKKTNLSKRAVYNQMHLAINSLKKDAHLIDLKQLGFALILISLS